MIKKSIRRVLRERAVQVLYAYEFNQDGRDILSRGMLTDIESDESSREFYQTLIDKAVIYTGEFNELLSAQLKNWEVERVSPIDRVILKIGYCELMYFPDIPPKVTMNECIELAKEFGSDDSSKFINGILDKMFAKLSKEGKIRKTGRGLIEQSDSAG